MKGAVVEVDPLGVGERAPKAVLVSLPEVELVYVLGFALRVFIVAVVVRRVLGGTRTQHRASTASGGAVVAGGR